jgi:hypothetical protein
MLHSATFAYQNGDSDSSTWHLKMSSSTNRTGIWYMGSVLLNLQEIIVKFRGLDPMRLSPSENDNDSVFRSTAFVLNQILLFHHCFFVIILFTPSIFVGVLYCDFILFFPCTLILFVVRVCWTTAVHNFSCLLPFFHFYHDSRCFYFYFPYPFHTPSVVGVCWTKSPYVVQLWDLFPRLVLQLHVFPYKT